MRSMNSLKAAVLFIVVSLGIAVYSFAAPVPQVIQYQGTLTDKNGVPSTGSYNMTFSVYSSATGSAPVWTEKMSSTNVPANPVIVTNGAFNVMLGALNPLDPGLFAINSKTYLGVKVGTDSEMVPRQRIASVGYAFAAGNGIPKGGIIMWSGAVNQIPDGWALCNGTNGTPDLRDRFIVGAGSGYIVGSKSSDVTGTINLSHSHTVSSHKHGIPWGGDHSHHMDFNLYSHIGDVEDDVENGENATVASESHGHHVVADSWGAGGHDHGGTDFQAPGTNNQLSATQDIRPPYYALAFIMKL